jgi:hypothetical protein
LNWEYSVVCFKILKFLEPARLGSLIYASEITVNMCICKKKYVLHTDISHESISVLQ